jgi:adenylate cyclase
METAQLRRTLALVFCDIANTMQLMAREGDLVMATLLRDFFENAGRLAREHHALLIKFIGDGALATFEDAGDALPFALSIQQLLDTLPSMRGRQLACRFSIHVGEALCIETSYGKDVFGDEVNIAARMNDLAEPDEIVVSRAALDRMPQEQQALAAGSERQRIKDREVEFHRVSLKRS